MLNIASERFINIAEYIILNTIMLSIKKAYCNKKTTPVSINAVSRLAAAPARETMVSSLRGFLKFLGLTITGFAQPKTDEHEHDHTDDIDMF